MNDLLENVAAPGLQNNDLIDAWPVFVAAAVVVFLWRTLPGRKRK